MRVLVTGGRDYMDSVAAMAALSELHAATPISAVLQGGATGADQWGALWGLSMQIPVLEWTADWKKHGKAAGPIRNQRMIDEGKPDLVIAFPGGRGTADMVRRARTAGIRVIEVEPTGDEG